MKRKTAWMIVSAAVAGIIFYLVKQGNASEADQEAGLQRKKQRPDFFAKAKMHANGV